MATENIVTGKKFRICTDAVNKIYDRISFWTKASDVYNNSDKALETTCGSITGITSSLTSTSTTMAASASAIKQLNDKIADLNSNLTNEYNVVKSNDALSSQASFTAYTATKKETVIISTAGSSGDSNLKTANITTTGTIKASFYSGNTTNSKVSMNFKVIELNVGDTITLNNPNTHGTYAIIAVG